MTDGTPHWVQDAVFYQIFPDRFARSLRVVAPGPFEPWDAPPTRFGFKGGNLPGITEHLGELRDLGVTALYLTPVFQSASNHRYQAYDYLAVDPLLGGTPALRELVDACHARGMRVVLDGVFNHAGRGFWAFHHVLEAGAASPYRDWFVFDQARLDAGRPVRAYPSPEEQRALEGAESTGAYRLGSASLRMLGYQAWWDQPALPKWNTANPQAREYLLSVAEHWIRFGVDGWRLDVPEEIGDADFWRELRRRVRAINPEAYLVGEIWHEAPEWLTGDRFDALMNYPLLEAVLGFTAGARLDRAAIAGQAELARNVVPLDAAGFASRLERTLSAYVPDVVAAQLNLLDSHDTPRFVTMAGGDRAALRLAVLLQMTLPGAPCIYYGDEVGLEGGADPDCRRAFPADPAAWDQSLRAFVRAAIALRHAHPALRGAGSFRRVAAQAMTHVHVRAGAGEVVLVAVNAGEAPERVEVMVPEAAGRSLAIEPLPGWSDLSAAGASSVAASAGGASPRGAGADGTMSGAGSVRASGAGSGASGAVTAGPFRVGAGPIVLDVPAREGLVLRALG
ncbi:MAG: glycoside hydrolase family 13 protein [Candidatus Limnocylindrales bacterium]